MAETDEMGKRSHLHIAYDGPALEAHRMDVKELAPALLAFSEMVERANEILNEDRASVRVEVRASFKEGSFGIDLEVVQGFTAWLFNTLNDHRVSTAKELLEWLGIFGGAGATGWGVLQLIRKLRGRTLERVEVLPDGRGVVLIDGERLEVERHVLQLLRDYKVRRCFEQLIAKPLASEGVDSFAVIDRESEQVLEYVGENEARFFIAPPESDVATVETEEDITLQIVSLSFAEGNKWRFTDGETSFHASIEAVAFLDAVDRRTEAFAKGDLLKVRLRKRQTTTTGGNLKMEYAILDVYEHVKQPLQPRLTLPDAD